MAKYRYEGKIQMSVIKVNRLPFHTKPASDHRLGKEMASFEILEKLDIPYTAIDHGAAATVEDCIEIEAVLGIEICKNLFLCNQSKTEFYLLVMPGAKRFVTKDVSKQIGTSRLSFAGAEFMEKYLNITPGSVSILGLMNDTGKKVHLLMDREIVQAEYIGCHPCINTSSLKIKTADILEKFLPHTGHKPLIVEI